MPVHRQEEVLGHARGQLPGVQRDDAGRESLSDVDGFTGGSQKSDLPNDRHRAEQTALRRVDNEIPVVLFGTTWQAHEAHLVVEATHKVNVLSVEKRAFVSILI